MADLEAIRERLEAVWGTAWDVERVREEEYFGDWVHVGPVLIPDSDPDTEIRYLTKDPEELARLRERDRAEAARTRALVEFLAHAADDIKALLDALSERRDSQ